MTDRYKDKNGIVHILTRCDVCGWLVHCARCDPVTKHPGPGRVECAECRQ